MQVLGYATVSMLCANLGWSAARAYAVLQDLVVESVAWVDGERGLFFEDKDGAAGADADDWGTGGGGEGGNTVWEERYWSAGWMYKHRREGPGGDEGDADIVEEVSKDTSGAKPGDAMPGSKSESGPDAEESKDTVIHKTATVSDTSRRSNDTNNDFDDRQRRDENTNIDPNPKLTTNPSSQNSNIQTDNKSIAPASAPAPASASESPKPKPKLKAGTGTTAQTTPEAETKGKTKAKEIGTGPQIKFGPESGPPSPEQGLEAYPGKDKVGNDDDTDGIEDDGVELKGMEESEETEEERREIEAEQAMLRAELLALLDRKKAAAATAAAAAEGAASS